MGENSLGQTPWQTVGPFFHYALPWKGGADLTGRGSDMGARPDLVPAGHYHLNEAAPRTAPEGEIIDIVGVLRDADGEPVGDGLLEIWQANAAGRYAAPEDDRDDLPLDEGFIGFGRCATQNDGSFRFRTVMPGQVRGPGDSLQAPHIAVGVLARGVLKRLCTRIYFEDDPALGQDPVLALAPENRRRTLLARREAAGVWRFDIRIAGPDETVFFDL